MKRLILPTLLALLMFPVSGWAQMPNPALYSPGGGGGGGGGSGSVGNCATADALAYYAATGTTIGCLSSVGTSGQLLQSAGAGLPPAWATVSSGSAANPTGSIGLSTVNGVLSTYLRSDGSPALSQAIIPTWTGAHTFAGHPVTSTYVSMTALAAVVTNDGNGTNSYAPGDVLTPVGGTGTEPTFTVGRTTISNNSNVTVVNVGNSGTPGPHTFQGTTGTGTLFILAGDVQLDGTLTGSSLYYSTNFGGNPGSYTANPTDIADEPIVDLTDGSLVGATVSVVMGVLTVNSTTAGSLTVLPSDPASTTVAPAGGVGAELRIGWSPTPFIVGSDATIGFTSDDTGQPGMKGDGLAAALTQSGDDNYESPALSLTYSNSFSGLDILPVVGKVGSSYFSMFNYKGPGGTAYAAEVNAYNARGIRGQPQNLTTNDKLLFISGNGWAEGWQRGVSIEATAAEDWGSGKSAASFVITTVDTVNESYFDRIFIDGSGNTSIRSGVFGIVQATWVNNQTCTAGQISVDADYLYVCTASNTVKRSPLSSF